MTADLARLQAERDAAVAECERLRDAQPRCGERSPVPWFTACVRSYPHDGMHEFRPLQSLYSTARCDECGNDRKAWDTLLADRDAHVAALLHVRNILKRVLETASRRALWNSEIEDAAREAGIK